ncbi:MAG: tRNA (N6-isopentenyl adenosine(37)-C2)-methylthiotransferase MiaB [Bacteroidales bacterium]|nr:tRNA (N6-isopentenyl adenosine(37)-C2)-methylthiotransferase MiaB [Bacteroidales bacterium]
MKYHIVTLGCQMNKSDSERVRTVVEGMGYSWTDEEEEANLLGILACSVRQKSIDKVYSRIARWNKWKNSRNLLTFVSGCVLPADREKFLKLFDLVFTMAELPELPDMVRQYGVVSQVAVAAAAAGSDPRVTLPKEKIREFWMVQPTYVSEFEAFIPIQNGCDKFCTFCAVPYTRGREISRPSQEILDEVKQVVEKGYKAITLLGQNVNSYGRDKQGTELSFPDLLKAIGEFGKSSGRDFWVYFTSPHPRDMSDEVLETVAQYDCLAKQIHLPLQSGDDKVLIRMNRKHTYEDYQRIICSIRRILPDATVFTDIIVGFTGETEEQFENSRKAMETIRFNMAYIAIYSPRPGAASARWDDDIPMAMKKNRLHVLTDELTKHTSEYNHNLIGKTLKVLVTGHDRKGGYLSGITEGRIVVRFASEQPIALGSFVWLGITSAASYSIEGELVNSPIGIPEPAA